MTYYTVAELNIVMSLILIIEVMNKSIFSAKFAYCSLLLKHVIVKTLPLSLFCKIHTIKQSNLFRLLPELVMRVHEERVTTLVDFAHRAGPEMWKVTDHRRPVQPALAAN